MKQYFSFAIVAIMMAAPMFFSSCGDDDLLPDDSQEQVMMEWTEPFHVKNSTVEEVKTFMASSMKGYRLVAETSTAESAQLAYATNNPNVGVLYSFSNITGQLYSVIDTELTINSKVIINFLRDHYDLVSSDKASSQYCFATPDKSMVITTVKVSDSCFNINYTFVY